MLRNFFKLFYLTFFYRQIFVTVAGIVIYFVWQSLFPNDFRDIENQFIFYLIFGLAHLVMGLTWGASFGSNLNWLLGLPYKKKNLFLAFIGIKLTSFIVSIVLFLFFLALTNVKWYTLKLGTIASLFEGVFVQTSTPGLFVGVITILAVMVVVVFSWVPRQDHFEEHRYSQKIINKLSIGTKIENKRIWIITGLVLLLTIVFIEYVKSPVSIFYIFSLSLLIAVIGNNIAALKVTNRLFRKHLRSIASVAVTLGFIGSYFLSYTVVTDGKSSSVEIIRELDYLGSLAPKIDEKIFVKILKNNNVTLENLRQLFGLAKFKQVKKSLRDNNRLETLLSHKKNWVQFYYVLRLYEDKEFSTEEVNLILKRFQKIYEKLGKNWSSSVTYSRVVYVSSLISGKKFSNQMVRQYLEDNREIVQAIGLVLARIHGDENLIPLFPEYSDEMSQILIDSKKYLVESVKYDCDGYEVSDAGMLQESDINELNSCLRKKIIKDRDSQVIKTFLRCGWIDLPLSKCEYSLVKSLVKE